MILAIDPGATESAFMFLADGKPYQFAKVGNRQIIELIEGLELRSYLIESAAIEMIACYGMAVGKEVFETVLFIGYLKRMLEEQNIPVSFVYRKQIVTHLCNSVSATDTNVRRVLLDRFGEKGTKKKPGVTYGISKDMWSALAVAVYHWDTKGAK